MSNDSTERTRCRECTLREAPQFTLNSDDDYVSVLYHYLDEHPDSDTFRNIIENTWIETLCNDCKQPFFSPMKLGQEGMHCDAYCPECYAEEWMRPLFVREVAPEELVEYQADPSEDELTRSVDTDTEQRGGNNG